MSGMAFTCPACGMTSHHPTDAAEGYCGNCHDWTARPATDELAAAIAAVPPVETPPGAAGPEPEPPRRGRHRGAPSAPRFPLVRILGQHCKRTAGE